MYSNRDLDAHGRPVCKECLGVTLRDEESGEDVCTKCGAVLRFSDSCLQVPASRVAIERSISYSSLPPVIHNDTEVPTIMGSRDVDAKGRHLGKNYELRQLRRLNAMVTWDPKRKRMARISGELRRASETLGLSNTVMSRAYEIYRTFDSGARVSSVSAAAVAAICVACTEMEIPRPPDDVVALKTNVDERKLRYHYKVLLKKTQPSGVPNPAIYVSSIAARARLNGQTERKALEILAKTKGSSELVGKRPVSIAAAALHLASLVTHDPTTQMQLAFAACISPITIRKRSAEISKILRDGIPESGRDEALALL